MTKAIFHPQAWVNDWAIDVDPQGETEFDVGEVPDEMESNDHDSDRLKDHPNAPGWVKNWSATFWIELVR